MVQFNTNVGMGINRQINQTSERIETIFQRLASGRRINQFSDDATGGVIATRLESQFRGITQEITNIQNNVSMIQTQEGAFGSITNDLQRIRELQVQAGNALVGPAEQNAIQDEIDQLVQNIGTTVENATFNDQQLIEPGAELQNILDNGIQATGSVADTNTVIEEVTSQRSEAGAQMNAMNSQIRSLEVTLENTIAASSRITDMDIAQGVAQLVNQQLIQQAGIQTMNSFMAVNRQSILGLLGS